MDITPLIPSDRKVIKSYGDGAFTLTNSERFLSSIVLFPDGAFAWDATDFAALSEQDFKQIVERAETLDVLIIGTGKQFSVLPAPLQHYLKSRGIRVETMDTGAACRTYNVLLSEERRVAAALIVV